MILKDLKPGDYFKFIGSSEKAIYMVLTLEGENQQMEIFSLEKKYIQFAYMKAPVIKVKMIIKLA